MSYRKTKEGQTDDCCSLCLQVKPISEFKLVRNPSRPVHRRYCPECRKIASRDAQLRAKPVTKEKRARWTRDWRARQPKERLAAMVRDSNLMKNYGIRHKDYERILAAQGGLCAICESPPVGKGHHNRLHVDHCHDTGVIRGLLCGKCNTAIGQMDEDVTRMYAAISYLESHKKAQAA